MSFLPHHIMVHAIGGTYIDGFTLDHMAEAVLCRFIQAKWFLAPSIFYF